MNAKRLLISETLPSPLGDLIAVADGDVLCALEFSSDRSRLASHLRKAWPEHRLVPGRLPAPIRRGIAAYFRGDFDALHAIPVAPRGTAFQRAVWDELRRIPPRRTISYGVLAARIGKPKAVRAVGLANSRNPIAIAVPCHRVIGANGTLTGYAGGIERKAWLLQHEGSRFERGAEHQMRPAFQNRAADAGPRK